MDMFKFGIMHRIVSLDDFLRHMVPSSKGKCLNSRTNLLREFSSETSLTMAIFRDLAGGGIMVTWLPIFGLVPLGLVDLGLQSSRVQCMQLNYLQSRWLRQRLGKHLGRNRVAESPKDLFQSTDLAKASRWNLNIS